MKKMFSILAIFILLLAVGYSYFWNSGTVKWEGESISESIITTGKDTSDVFDFVVKEQGGKGVQYRMPDEITFMTYAIEGAHSDSTNVKFALYLSNDQTYWYSYGNIDTLTSVHTDTAKTTVGYCKPTLPKFRYGKFIVTGAAGSGDTVTVGVQMSKYYNAD